MWHANKNSLVVKPYFEDEKNAVASADKNYVFCVCVCVCVVTTQVQEFVGDNSGRDAAAQRRQLPDPVRRPRLFKLGMPARDCERERTAVRDPAEDAGQVSKHAAR